jgi:peptidoglycan/LPS O-acetylase OafA/YrhL
VNVTTGHVPELGRSLAPWAVRDPFLDALRAFAALRVVALHTFDRDELVGAPWIEWIVPGMPVMFFVSGVLLADSLRRRRALGVVRSRVRRVLLPLWVLAGPAIALMVASDLRSDDPGMSVSVRGLAGFAIPWLGVTGSAGRSGWWAHLWFLTALCWCVLAAPLMARWRTVLGPLTLLIPLATLLVAISPPFTSWVHVPFWLSGAMVHGLYLELGTQFSDARAARAPFRSGGQPGRWDGWWRRWSSGRATGVLAGCSLACVVLLAAVPAWRASGEKLYHTPMAAQLVGAAWLLAILAGRRPLSSWAQRVAGPARAVSRRTLTMFLWGPPAIAVGLWLDKSVLGPDRLGRVTYPVAALSALAVLVAVLGPIEDLAAGRGRLYGLYKRHGRTEMQR